MKLSKKSKTSKLKKSKKQSSSNITILLMLIVLIFIYFIFKSLKSNTEGFTANYDDFNNQMILLNDHNTFSNLINNTNKTQNESKSNNSNNKLNNKLNNNTNDNDEEIHYLYWTGGYDSTFRLCEMLLDENKIVQPIYVALVLDNDCQSEETCSKLWLRRNRKEEYTAMENVADKIKEKYPHVKDRLLKTLIIDDHIKDDTFNFNFEKKFYSKNLWPRKRKTHQYLFLSKYSSYHKKHIDIGVLGIHKKALLAKFLKKNLKKTEDNYEIQIKNHPLYYIRFPLYGRSKEMLLEKAQVNGYSEILQLTWSCWFPKDGKPCDKCPMCKERIVEHPDNKTD
jgi:hypothetical protein